MILKGCKQQEKNGWEKPREVKVQWHKSGLAWARADIPVDQIR